MIVVVGTNSIGSSCHIFGLEFRAISVRARGSL